MNRIIIFISFVVSIFLINGGISIKAQLTNLREKDRQLKINNSDLGKKISAMESLPKRSPVDLSVEYGLFINQVKLLEGYSGTSMNVQLEGFKDTEDISNHYVDTSYRDVKGLRIQIVVDKFSKETDMGAILDDIHLLEKNTDFMAWEIMNGNNGLIVKGEIYGI